MKFYGNPSSESRADTYRLTHMTKVIGAFRAYTNVPQTETKIRENMALKSDLCCITSVFLIRAAPPGLKDRKQII
jgi:hypothetical protein